MFTNKVTHFVGLPSMQLYCTIEKYYAAQISKIGRATTMFEVLYACQHRYLPVVLYICKYPSKFSHSNYVIIELKTPCFLKFRQLQFSFFDDSFGHILDSWDVLHAPCGHFSENWGKLFFCILYYVCAIWFLEDEDEYKELQCI